MPALNRWFVLAVMLVGAGGLLDDHRAAGQQVPKLAASESALKGKVTYDGVPPELPPFTEREDFKRNSDRVHCLKGPVNDPTWTVGKGKEVANVVVWLRPGDGTVFVIPEALRRRTETVELDQPYCAFEPHIRVLFPAYRDADGKEIPTGQKFVARNSAPINQNVKLTGSAKKNPQQNFLIPGKRNDQAVAEKEIKLNPDPLVITIADDLHKWKRAYVWAFDHPYAAVTEADGEFVIRSFPGNAEVFVVAWHEDAGFLLPPDNPSAKGQPIKLEAGKFTELNLSIKKR